LEGRIARIESAVTRMADVLEALPDLAGMGMDVADEEAARLTEAGVDVDGRVRKVTHTVVHLTRPEVLERLEQAADQAVALEGTLGMLGDVVDAWADRLAERTGVPTDQRVDALVDTLVRATEPRTLDTLQRLLDQADALEGFLGMTLDMGDDVIARLGRDGHDPEQRIAGLLRLVERLAEPRFVALAHKVLDRADSLEQLMDVALAAPDTVGMMLDVWDEMLMQAEAEGLELDLLLDRTIQVILRAGRLAGSDELQELIDSYVLDPGAVQVISGAANALAETRSEPAGKAGMFKALGALSDPRIQTALDFAIRFGRRFGDTLEAPAQLPDRS